MDIIDFDIETQSVSSIMAISINSNSYECIVLGNNIIKQPRQNQKGYTSTKKIVTTSLFSRVDDDNKCFINQSHPDLKKESISEYFAFSITYENVLKLKENYRKERKVELTT